MNLKRLTFRSLAAGLNALSYVAPARAGRYAFHLFATPPPPHLRAKEQAFLDTAVRLDRKINDHLIPVYRWGAPDAPICFTAYGWGYNAGRWRHYVPALIEAGYRVIAFDFPGHGQCKGPRQMTYPMLVDIELQLIRSLGKIDLVLAHSFGGSCLVEALTLLPEALRPRRICLMAIVSEVRWLFAGFAQFMGFRDVVYRQMQAHIELITGRNLDEFDVARVAGQLGEIPTLLVHDPGDSVTAYRNALRNHSHWPGSWLYSPEGAGHHLGTTEVTHNILRWLINGKGGAAGWKQNTGMLAPLPAVVDPRDMEVDGVTNFYG